MKHIEKTDLHDAMQDLRMQMAIDQSAMHVANLALARWASGISCVEMQLAQALSVSSQPHWYATVQDNFIAWLAAGGFAQREPEPQPYTATHACGLHTQT